MLLYMIQWGGERYHPGPVNLLEPIFLLLIGLAAGVILVPLLERSVPRGRRAMRLWRARRRHEPSAPESEERAVALMSELCPFGWRAQITLFEHSELAAADGLPAEERPARIRLEWVELRDAAGTPAVMRELWADTVGGALEAMVADRATDETLEQIEQGAAADGALWPDRE